MLISAAMTKEEQAKEMARLSAIDDLGYNSIELELTDQTRTKIGAVETVVPQFVQRSPQEGGSGYIAKIVSGDVQFSRRGGVGKMRAWLLDTEFNRYFLASHLDCGYWRIVTEGVIEDINRRHKELVAEAVDMDAIGQGVPVGANVSSTKIVSVAGMTDDDLDAELQRLVVEKARRDAQVTPKPTRTRKRRGRGAAPQTSEEAEQQGDQEAEDEVGDAPIVVEE